LIFGEDFKILSLRSLELNQERMTISGETLKPKASEKSSKNDMFIQYFLFQVSKNKT
jgi:hypothetical protein